MAGLCEGGNEPAGSLKAICKRPGSGRPRATNPNEDRYMVLRVLRERNLPATSVAQQFVNMHGRPIRPKQLEGGSKQVD
ncbi:hypothetical protein ANN_19634 [Periplaneta americana]|uniref:Uncharacterized protein n=1 Tax=Periplaneta americana TaxID=6978 RepID=A0ABQ8SB31_PERAM|nr:hypothetical protein ANN_19634 [Periplaneta americana]